MAAYDVETGRELWTDSREGEFRESMGGDGPRATPTYHNGRVYALGALGELRCLDARTGALVWRRNILEENGARNLSWGMAASPLIVDEKVIVPPGGRYGYGHLLLADSYLIVLTEAGDVVLVKASPERHQEIARFSAIVGKTWNHSVIAGGCLLIRNGQEMAAFDIRPSAPHEPDSSGSIGE